jgi:ketosteroid isomerase-like protein
MSQLISQIEAMDRCWLVRRFGDLAEFIAEDVVMVPPGDGKRIRGLEAAVESYREFMSRSEVRRYCTSGHVVTERGDAAVMEYDWDMAWECDGILREAIGREIVVLAHRDRGWRVVWRMQLSRTD